MDNRFATALVIGSVLSLLSVIYLAAAVGTASWYQYFTPSTYSNYSGTSTEDFLKDPENTDEKAYTDALFHYNGSFGLWQRCITVAQSTWYQQSETDSNAVSHCVMWSWSDQFFVKYEEPGNHNTEVDIVRTYLWRCQFILPLVALGLIFLGALIGLAGCVCHSLGPALGTGILHLLAGLCTLGSIVCFSRGVHMLEKRLPPPAGIRGEYGWSFCLACVSSPLQIMAGALFLWAVRASRREYSLMKAYRVA
ncbi:claudin domain-containing protein 1 [Bombina bombina]|uniref:claudin domain-containing protein 1 n=1 Tax=Bombina bombina TaxID=8345 RepID=UPI00235AD556|nr:claudin domain-containing protein 1 [Bombina bombina]XP_053547676.1 claudin domain-containing protein 1 [Bombina bombina]